MKNKIACINGPNLNLLGSRKQNLYGVKTLKGIEENLKKIAKQHDFAIVFFQSNCEGDIVDFIQKERNRVQGIIINAGPLSFYGYALRDALEDTGLPAVTVHLSNIYTRKEEFRHKDIIAEVAVGGVFGFKEESYFVAFQALVNFIQRPSLA